MVVLVDLLPPAGSDPSDVLDAFATWAADERPPAVPAPGGGGAARSPPATTSCWRHRPARARASWRGGHRCSRSNDGRRAVWTAPIKALVAEKFFDLVDLLGAERVGLATGDAAINVDAPVLVCTAEVLANHALATGAASEYGFACLDEFHYYGDPDRGWAWQVPLLELTDCQMLLASATLGDMTAIATDLERAVGPRRDRGDVGRPADAAVPPVADDVGVRQRARCGARRPEPGVRGARQPGGGDRTRPGSGEPERHDPRAARGDRRGDGRGEDGAGLRRDARPADPQRGRRAPRRHAAALPPARRTAGRRRAAAGDLRHRHARASASTSRSARC